MLWSCDLLIKPVVLRASTNSPSLFFLVDLDFLFGTCRLAGPGSQFHFFSDGIATAQFCGRNESGLVRRHRSAKVEPLAVVSCRLTRG